MFRPQFAFPPSPGDCTDQTCMYSFDSTNTPKFAGTLAAGAQTGRIPLRLDKGADFYLRAVRLFGNLSIRLEDTDGNQLNDSENLNESQNFVRSSLYGDTQGAGFVALESGAGGVFGPGGGNYVVYLYNPTAVTIDLTTCAVNLIGVKRYPGEACL
jgi:hypothetical protein